MRHPYEAIAVGTSAGGYQALAAILEALPETFPLPIIIVQHRAKDSHDLFEDILQLRTRMKVRQADEKEPILPGVIYSAPPDYHLLVEMDKTFSLSFDPLVKFSRPAIDVLFESAAEVYSDRLIGVILTGSNADGADGIRAIKRKGGLTIAQDPAHAEYGSMPRAAIETGHVEHVFTLRQIGDFLVSLQQEAMP